MFFKRKYENRRQESPSEMVDLTSNLIAKVWSAKNRDGSLRVNFGLRRRSEDAAQPYLSMRPESITEFPEALAKLGRAFSQVEGLPEDVRVECGEFAVLMQKFVELQESNGSPSDEKNKPDSGRILNLA